MRSLLLASIILLTSLSPAQAQLKPARGLVKAITSTPAVAASSSKVISNLPKTTAAVSWGIAGMRSTDEMEALYCAPAAVQESFRCSPQAVILDKYDKMFHYGAPLISAVDIPSPERALYIKQARAALLAPFPDITPTDHLVHYYKLSPALVGQYQDLYQQIYQFHLYILKRLKFSLASSAPQWTPMEKQEFDAELTQVDAAVQNMLKHMGGLDPALEQIMTDIQWSRELISNMPGQFVLQDIKRTEPFNLNQYCLFSAPGMWPRHAIRNDDLFFNPALARQTAAQFCSQLPANLKVAVLNDSPRYTSQYENWTQEGVFTNGLTVSTFLSVNDFLRVHRQQPFDIILTDYFIPGGGGNLLVKLLRSERDFTPVILHSYAGEGHNAWEITRPQESLQKEYNLGYDAFLPTNDDFFSSRGYLYILEGLRNFYAAQKLHPQRG